MFTFSGAEIEEQNVKFAVVLVNDYGWIDSAGSLEAAGSIFGPLPIVLAHREPHGSFEYLGRPDLAKFLASIDVSQIPWREYTVR